MNSLKIYQKLKELKKLRELLQIFIKINTNKIDKLTNFWRFVKVC